MILGLPFVLFSPGYTFLLVLLPKREQMGGVERIALSLGVSIIIVPVIGLVFNYTPIGITPNSVLYALSSFILIMSIIGWLRSRKLLEIEKPQLEIQIKKSSSTVNTWDKVFAILLVIVILATIGVTGYLIVKPKIGETFTEFYILGPGGKAENYPEQLILGETANVTVGVINHENTPTNYLIKILVSGLENDETGPFLLNDGEKWENVIAFTPKVVGDSQKVEFFLYISNDMATPINSLHLWINVKDKIK